MSYKLHHSGRDNAAPPGRVGQKRKRTSQEPHEEIAWTAARCNRLLRSISSRINTLRRLLNTDDRGHLERNKKPQACAGLKPGTEHWSTADPVWLPGGLRKPQRKTYTAKAKTPKACGNQAIQPKNVGSLAFPSPFVKRLGARDVGTVKVEDLGAQYKTPPRTRRSTKLPLKSTSAVQEAEKGLKLSLDIVLSATAEPSLMRSKGASSLLQTCLRKVPAYVDLQNSDEDNDLEDDATSEIFSYLEEYGTVEGGGWVGLRRVVRSQVVHVICCAIQDEMLSHTTIHALINACSLRKAVREGQQLIEAWLLSAGSLLPGQIGILHSWTRLHNCEGFKYRTLSMLAEKNAANYTKFAELARFGIDLLSSITGNAGDEAVEYLQRWIAFSVRQDVAGHLKEKTRSEIMATTLKLAVMSVTSSLLENSHFDSHKLREAVYCIAAALAIEIPGNLNRKSRRLAKLSMFSAQLLMSLGQSLSQPTPLSKAFATSIHCTGGHPGDAALRGLQEEFAAAFADSLVELEGHLHLGIPELFLNAVVNENVITAPDTSLLKAVALEVITAVKQAGCNEVLYAQYLQQILTCGGGSAPRETPHQEARQGQFRWEDGLCEWILATPFADGRVSSSESDADGRDNCSATADSDHLQAPLEICGSPDVLATSPPVQQVMARESGADESFYKGRKGIVVIYVGSRAKRRKSSRLSAREESQESQESDDELGF